MAKWVYFTFLVYMRVLFCNTAKKVSSSIRVCASYQLRCKWLYVMKVQEVNRSSETPSQSFFFLFFALQCITYAVNYRAGPVTVQVYSLSNVQFSAQVVQNMNRIHFSWEGGPLIKNYLLPLSTSAIELLSQARR